jgi:hypothetical protein
MSDLILSAARSVSVTTAVSEVSIVATDAV